MPNARPSSLSSTPAYQPRVHKFVRIFPVLNVCGLLEKYPRLNSPLTAYLIVDSFHRLVKRGISGGGGGEERERDFRIAFAFPFFLFPSPPLLRGRGTTDFGWNRRYTTLSPSKFFPVNNRLSGAEVGIAIAVHSPLPPTPPHGVYAENKLWSKNARTSVRFCRQIEREGGGTCPPFPFLHPYFFFFFFFFDFSFSPVTRREERGGSRPASLKLGRRGDEENDREWSIEHDLHAPLRVCTCVSG